ncbi:MAG: PLP-dependent aminotransferase family protein [Methanothrix sp.]|nr:PLP-dependent aminotransferase family protein [Methanothrix sp.]MDD4448704.1 PLP-dependent aminotransferase family protein [Methanothrix sp.]
MTRLFADRMSCVHRSFVREILKVTEDPEIISFAGGLPNPKYFPVQEVAAAAEKVLSECGEASLQYSTTEGYLPLREMIAQRYARRGVKVSASEILITNGSQQALDLLGKVFLNKGDGVILERPTYLAAIQSFGFFEPKFHSITLQEDGVDPQALKRVLSKGDSKLFYSVPNFQNPTGITYSRDKLRAVAQELSEGSTVFIEDNPYGDLRFMGEDRPSMRNYLGENAVLLGSFSKIVAPGVRLGWVCACEEIMEKLIVAKQASDLHSNYLCQRILHQYLKDNDIERHIAKIRRAYKDQRDFMVQTMQETFPENVSFTRPEGGMFLWATLPESMSSLDLFNRAIEEKVAFVPGQAFYADGGGSNTMRLNFSNSNNDRIFEGVTRLAKAIKEEAP